MHKNSKRGSMLVPALIIMMAVVLMGAALITMGLWSVQSSVNSSDGSQAYYAAKSVADAIANELFATQGITVGSNEFGSKMNALFFNMNKGTEQEFSYKKENGAVTADSFKIDGLTGISTDNTNVNCEYNVTFKCKGFYDLYSGAEISTTITDDIKKNSTQLINLTVECKITQNEISETSTTEAVTKVRTITKQIEIDRKTAISGLYALGTSNTVNVDVNNATVIGDVYLNTINNDATPINLNVNNITAIDGDFYLRSANKGIDLANVKIDNDKDFVVICENGNVNFNGGTFGTVFADTANGFALTTMPTFNGRVYLDSNATDAQKNKFTDNNVSFEQANVGKIYDIEKVNFAEKAAAPTLTDVDANNDDVTITTDSLIKNYDNTKTITANTAGTIWIEIETLPTDGTIGNIVITGGGKVNLLIADSSDVEITSVSVDDNCTFNVIYKGAGTVKINCYAVATLADKEDTSKMIRMNVIALGGTVEIADNNRIWGTVIGNGLHLGTGSVVRTIPDNTAWWGNIEDLLTRVGSDTIYKYSTTYAAKP